MPYQLQTFKRLKDKTAPPELKQIHPLGKSPVVTISTPNSSEPLVMAESAAIVEYLVDHFGPNMIPRRYREGKEGQVGGETEEWLSYRFFMHYAEGSLMPYLVMTLIVQSIKGAPVPFFLKPITGMVAGNLDSSFVRPNLRTNYDFLEEKLASATHGGPYLCGAKLTGADILMSFPLGAARARAGMSSEKYPKLSSYLDLIQDRDAYKRAIQKISEVEGSYEPFL